jgi:hypothetical protein
VSADTPTDNLPIAPATAASVFSITELANELRQGEIITGLTQYFYDPVTEDVERLIHPYSIILSQDCDLLRDHESRKEGSDGALTSVLLYIAEPAKDVKGSIGGTDIWKRVIANNNERYHLLSQVPTELDLKAEGMPNLLLDFREFFTLPPEEIYRQCTSGQAVRRCRVDMPYREHLQSRAAFYFQRVMLPEPHKYIAG